MVLTDAGGPSGVPGGKPSIASEGKMAAAIMHAPKPARNQVRARGFHASARPNPTAAAITIRPVITKFAVWIQPPGPSASTLSGCRAMSNPSRSRTWMRATER